MWGMQIKKGQGSVIKTIFAAPSQWITSHWGNWLPTKWSWEKPWKIRFAGSFARIGAVTAACGNYHSPAVLMAFQCSDIYRTWFSHKHCSQIVVPRCCSKQLPMPRGKPMVTSAWHQYSSSLWGKETFQTVLEGSFRPFAFSLHVRDKQNFTDKIFLLEKCIFKSKETVCKSVWCSSNHFNQWKTGNVQQLYSLGLIFFRMKHWNFFQNETVLLKFLQI